MHKEPRNGASIDRVYLHKNEGPESEGGAAGLANYLQSIDGGYHVIVDDKSTIRCADDDQVVWGEGGDNEHALAICLVGWSAETAAQYGTDDYSKAEIGRAAQQVAAWCKAYNVPVVHVRPGAPGQAPTDRGIAEHADDHDPASQGHTDPGTGFPIAGFITLVQTIVSPPLNIANLQMLAQWKAEVTAEPLRANESSWKVTALKELLDHIGEGPGNDEPIYGSTLVERVHAFKVKHGDSNTDGSVFGGTAAALLFKAL